MHGPLDELKIENDMQAPGAERIVDDHPPLDVSLAAVEPRVLGFPGFPRELGEHAAAGLVRFKWPVKPTVKEIQQLLAVPWIRADLAVAAAVAGLFASRRLGRLTRALGEQPILETLVATGRGWDEICRLPQEKPPLELRLLLAFGRLEPQLQLLELPNLDARLVHLR